MLEQSKPINGLRGISALTVLFYHALGFGAVASVWYRFGVGGGFAAVYVFFALSAFLLCRGPTRSWSEYYTHRFFRIFPVWFVVLPLFILVGLVPFSPELIALSQNWFPSIAGISNPTWTLSIELVFYAALPLWRTILDRAPWALFGACAVLTLASVHASDVHLFGFLPSAGISLLAYASGSLAARGKLPALGTLPASALMLGGFAVAAVWGWTAPLVVGLAAGFMLVQVPAMLGQFDKLGAMAYPVYLLGYPLLYVGRAFFADPWVVLAFNVTSVLALAVVVHRWVEQPAISLGKRVCAVLARHKSSGTV
jgi:peptidoglycan/LPS O-acetylase OafA/YrhL